jgi:putative transposase
MGRKYKIHDQQQVYFVTFTVVGWIDLFIRDEYKEIVTDITCSGCSARHPEYKI